jgi:hypothetical protein
MSEIITLPKLSRLEAIAELPLELQDNALLPWDTVTVLFARKDVESTREWVKSRGIKLVDAGRRRKLPTWKDIRNLLQGEPVT